jgi:hypothetical protein
MIEIPVGLQPELVPLAWVIGTWEGTGMIEYSVDGQLREHAFRQQLEFTHRELPFLEYRSQLWLLDDESGEETPLTAESGYWRLARPRTDGDVGPGILPPSGDAPVQGVDDVEALRNATGGFDLEVTLAHPTGLTEIYTGTITGPRIDLATSSVQLAEGAHAYESATRMYGLVNNMLFWAWDIAALGQELATHASGQLSRVSNESDES